MVNFWNGNKSESRQKYEYALLKLLLEGTSIESDIYNDVTDYPLAEDEGAVFENGTDVLVTVAGNQKFIGKSYHEVKLPLCKGLLGWRLMVIDKHRLGEFQLASVEQLKNKVVGVPDTWVDATLFRENGYQVLEKGNLEDMLGWVADGTVDYLTLGANEAADILTHFSDLSSDLVIEPTIALYYPFPLVFYVNGNKPKLAKELEQAILTQSEQVDTLFERYYGHVREDAKLQHRSVVKLDNPLLPSGYTEMLEKFL